jgi:hypothetical protein
VSLRKLTGILFLTTAMAGGGGLHAAAKTVGSPNLHIGYAGQGLQLKKRLGFTGSLVQAARNWGQGILRLVVRANKTRRTGSAYALRHLSPRVQISAEKATAALPVLCPVLPGHSPIAGLFCGSYRISTYRIKLDMSLWEVHAPVRLHSLQGGAMPAARPSDIRTPGLINAVAESRFTIDPVLTMARMTHGRMGAGTALRGDRPGNDWAQSVQTRNY